MNGLILINKPPGITSFQVLTPLKKTLSPAKVGHAGTLDKFAEGLLVVLAGRYTRLVSLFTRLEKEYRATIVFGKGTATDDPEGEITGTGPVPSEDVLKATLSRFQGTIMQRPPLYSAVHVGGRRASACARRGLQVELEPRPVTIHALRLIRYEPPETEFQIICSKGTYIRSLARDIAAALGTYAFVSRLCRERIGSLSVAEAVSPDAFKPDRDMRTGSAFLESLPAVQRITIAEGREEDLRCGRPLAPHFFHTPPREGENIVLTADGRLLAVVVAAEGKLAYKMVLHE